MKKMSYGLKISKEGYDVMNLNSVRKDNSGAKTNLIPILSVLALAYLIGAKKQIIRYQAAASKLIGKQVREGQGVIECLHEASTLFEDLCAIGIYMEKSKNSNIIHKLWKDIRSHIRHDFREEFDKENIEAKNKRAINLKLDANLQANIGFDIDAINVGGITIEIKQIQSYLNWAEKIIIDIIDDAKKNGYIE